jgi:hypothetical protein
MPFILRDITATRLKIAEINALSDFAMTQFDKVPLINPWLLKIGCIKARDWLPYC